MSTTTESPNTTPEGRESNGQFAKGNHGGPGNPYARQVAQLRLRALDSVSGDDVEAILSKMVELAKAGDVPAARLVLHYTLGKPVACAHPDRIDEDEMEAFKANATKKDVEEVVGSTPVESTLVVLRELMPSKTNQILSGLGAHLREQNAREQAEAEKATVSKRSKRVESAPVSADPAVAFAEAETLRLVNQPEGDDGQSDRRAANPRR